MYESKGSCPLRSMYKENIRFLYQSTQRISLQVVKRGNDKAGVELRTVRVYPSYVECLASRIPMFPLELANVQISLLGKHTSLTAYCSKRSSLKQQPKSSFGMFPGLLEISTLCMLSCVYRW